MGILHKLFDDDWEYGKSSKSGNKVGSGKLEKNTGEVEKTTSGYSAYGNENYEDVPYMIYERQVGETMEILLTTLNPGTFFSRYRFLSNTSVDHMEAKKKVYNDMTPKQLYKWLNNKNTQNKLQQLLIDRMFDNHRENNIIYEMSDVGAKFTKESMQYYLKRLGARQFHFCKVKFDADRDKLYTYVTKNKNLTVGDTVTVSKGRGEYKETNVVQVEEVFDDCVQNLPFPLEKLRCVDSKLRGIECPHCGASIQVDVGKKTGKCDYCGAEFYLL